MGQLFFRNPRAKVPDLGPDSRPFSSEHHLYSPLFPCVAKAVVNEIVEDPCKLLSAAPDRQFRLYPALQAISLLLAQREKPGKDLLRRRAQVHSFKRSFLSARL